VNINFRFVPTAACAVTLALAIVSTVTARSARAGDTGDNRAQSNAIVQRAEAIVNHATAQNPINSNEVRQAIDMLHRALRIDPENDSAYVDLGFCYSELRDAPTAVDMYNHAVKINPSAQNYKELADIYLRIEDGENALMAANAGLLKDPQNASLYNAKGMALNDLQRFDEAAIAFRRALQIDPNFRIARENLAAVTGKSVNSVRAPSRTN
jgi:Flp pilus assembly protein TadD